MSLSSHLNVEIKENLDKREGEHWKMQIQVVTRQGRWEVREGVFKVIAYKVYVRKSVVVVMESEREGSVAPPDPAQVNK